jgi:hypothetical protein
MKKLGLPNFSSHSCSVSLTVEIPDASIAAQESSKLYQLLQTAVDNEIQEVGFMPDAVTYGMNNGGNGAQSNANGNSRPQSGNTHQRPVHHHGTGEVWNCTDGQRGLILRIINENRLDKNEVEGMAQQLFSLGVKQLDKMQASQLIEELLEKVGKSPQRSRWRGQPQSQR